MTVIDLINGDDLIVTCPKEESPEVLAEREKKRLEFLKEVFRRAPKPDLQIVPNDGAKR